MVCNRAPLHNHSLLWIICRTSPHHKHRVKCSIACPLTIAQYRFGKGIIKECFDKPCPFSLVLMVSKKCSDFCPMFFQGIAGTQQFILFSIRVVIRHLGVLVPLIVKNLQPGRANGTHHDSANISRYRYTSSFSTISSAAAWMLFISPTHFIWFSAFRLSFTPSCFAICAVSVSIISFA